MKGSCRTFMEGSHYFLPHILPHIFDPFYSGREAGRGLGFGLSKAWRIITDHGGSIVVDSQPGHGATFVVRLPIGNLSPQGSDQFAATLKLDTGDQFQYQHTGVIELPKGFGKQEVYRISRNANPS